MSDNQDEGFQDLGEEYQQILDADQTYQRNGNQSNYHLVPTQSTIRYNKNFKQQMYKVKIESGEHKIDMNILQSQFYTVKLYQKQKSIKQNLERRYSDFDLLFEVLQKRYPGYVFPAFPEKGILAYVKTKVTVVKDEKFLRNRIKMIERFLNVILNEEKFNPQKCQEIKKFFSISSEFELFKKTAREELSRNKSIVDSTWGMIKDFFKMSQATKYTTVIEELRKQKLVYEELLAKTQDLMGLVNDQLEANRALSQFEASNRQRCRKYVQSFGQLSQLNKNLNQQLEPLLTELSELEFDLECENQDYLMVLKKIELIEQMRESEQNYKSLGAIEKQFSEKRNQFKVIKQERIQKLKLKFKDILETINSVEREKD